MDATIPDKLYFRIGEAAALAEVRPSVLRFWETQFAEILPQKSGSGQRIYSREQVVRILEIQRLLYKEKLTIAGAQQRLRQIHKAEKVTLVQEPPVSDETKKLLQQVVDELQQIQQLLNS